MEFEVKTAEAPDERASRLRREEADDNHKRRISYLAHIFVAVAVTGAFLVGAWVVLKGDPKTGLTEKAMNVITAIVAAGVGYVTGKGSK